ncbi:MAG: SDR family NAD(P)-dependent oxidoreductase [Alphaproteobacteria bacterium]|jgi:NAD(P)-dependent dehydrogenase (short-subunit alcohol dehydrogenase family)|nr:SDR family oxidoreductase [Rhodospirillaceae bacterium]MBT6510642.1 SDR family oxidoreductase [Rhodospirillaceae bacterium]MBT7613020.1 SDR family oxidoreductase [Rhodospirillaceae bacterium]MDG2480837.1 SDR family NAD(P)-dependent oxidoreductase [Alphaproteobacteria bacterium]
MDFTDKRVLVTGGSRGIGFATATAFLDAGAWVAVNGRTEGSVSTAMDRLGRGDRVVAAPGDIATVVGCEAAVQTAVEAFGGLDILVNCAGIGSGRPIELFDEEMWDVHMDVNLKGTFFTCRAALLELRKSKGNIVNIGSDAGLMGVPGIVAYCASKGGVVNMTKAMALELAPDIRVNCICPGYVDTDMIRRDHIDKKPDPSKAEQGMIDYAPLKRIATPEEIAHAIMYLASHEARFVSGAALPIDGAASAGR